MYRLGKRCKTDNSKFQSCSLYKAQNQNRIESVGKNLTKIFQEYDLLTDSN